MKPMWITLVTYSNISKTKPICIYRVCTCSTCCKQNEAPQTIVAVTSSVSSSEEFHEPEFSFHTSSLENSQRPQKLLPPVIITYFSLLENILGSAIRHWWGEQNGWFQQTSSGFLEYTLTIISWQHSGSKWLIRASGMGNFSTLP